MLGWMLPSNNMALVKIKNTKAALDFMQLSRCLLDGKRLWNSHWMSPFIVRT
jgi:hypothetical protein